MNIVYYGLPGKEIDNITNLIDNYMKKRRISNYCILTYSDDDALINSYLEGNPLDIIFIDIDVNNSKGVKLARKLRSAGSEAMLIYLSNRMSFIFEAFELEALDYIIKPISKDKVDRILTRALTKYLKTNDILTIRGNGGHTLKIPLNDVVYIKSVLHYTYIYMVNGERCKLVKKLSQMEEILKPYKQFLRTHQSYIVNLNYVSEASRDKLMIRKPFDYISPEVPISRVHIKGVHEYYTNYNSSVLIDWPEEYKITNE